MWAMNWKTAEMHDCAIHKITQKICYSNTLKKKETYNLSLLQPDLWFIYGIDRLFLKLHRVESQTQFLPF